MRILDNGFWQGKRVFVTGGTGFVGSHLVLKLQELGAVVKLFIHCKSAPSSLIGYKGDLCISDDGLKRYLEAFKPQIIFHLAAQPIVNLALENHLDTLKVNIDGTYNLLSSCYHLRWIENIVVISTDKVYGNVPLIMQDAIPHSVTHPYNTSKLAADFLAQMYGHTFGTPITVIRNGNVYGPGDEHWDRIIPNNFRRVLDGIAPEIRGTGKSYRDYIHVDDIVVGYINAASRLKCNTSPRILNLGAKRPYRVIEVINQILEIANRTDLAPTMSPLGVGEIPNQHIMDKSATALIGWEPEIDLEYGLRLTLPWYAQRIREHAR